MRIAPFADKKIPEFQKKLIHIAFEAASAIPVDPFIKDRSRVQAKVIAVYLELDQVDQAFNSIGKIENWQKGAAYADLAFYCGSHACSKEVAGLLQSAEKIADLTQDWRRDNIRVKIARTHALLGQTTKAGQYEAGVVNAEKGKVAGVRAMQAGADSFDEHINAVDKAIATKNFDEMSNTLKSATVLYGRFYGDSTRRARVEDKIRNASIKFPVFLRMELLEALAVIALEHQDRAKALSLVNEAEDIMDTVEWSAESHISEMAKLAGLRFRAGDKEKARSSAVSARELFEKESEKMVNMERGSVLRPLAEAFTLMGDLVSARGVYTRALAEGAENPNARPRAEDLAATCLSLALRGVDPDTVMWEKIVQIKMGLVAPW